MFRGMTSLRRTILWVVFVPAIAAADLPPIGHIAGFGVSRSCCESSYTIYGRTSGEKAFSAIFQIRPAGTGVTDWTSIGPTNPVDIDSTLWMASWNPCLLQGKYELRTIFTDSLGDAVYDLQPILYVEIEDCEAVPVAPSNSLANGGFDDWSSQPQGLINVFTDTPELHHSAIAVWSFSDGTFETENLRLFQDIGDSTHYLGSFGTAPIPKGGTGTFWIAYNDFDSLVTHLSRATLTADCGLDPIGFPFCFENGQVCARVCIDPGSSDDEGCIALFPSRLPTRSVNQMFIRVLPNCALGMWVTVIRWTVPPQGFRDGKYAEVQISYRTDDPQECLAVARWDFSGETWRFDNIILRADSIKDGLATFSTPIDQLEGMYAVIAGGDGICPPPQLIPPPCPDIHLESDAYGIRIRWSGEPSETFYDPIAGQRDFEGYRLYAGSSDSPNQFLSVGSWDMIDYQPYVYQENNGSWNKAGDPQTVEQLRSVYGAEFEPDVYSVPSPESCYEETFTGPGNGIETRCLYFEPIDQNHGNSLRIGGETIPNIIQQVALDSVVETGEGTLHYGLYEAHLTASWINSHVPGANSDVCVAVTAFNFVSINRTGANFTPTESPIRWCTECVTVAELDLTPPITTIGVLQNPLLPSFLDIFVTTNEALTTVPVVAINGDTLVLNRLSDSLHSVYSFSYEVSGPGSLSLSAQVVDSAGNITDTTEVFQCFLADPSGGSITSTNGRFEIEIPSGSFENERLLLLFQHQDAEGTVYEMRPDGFALAGAAEVRIACDAAMLAGNELRDLHIFRKDVGGQWEQLPTVFDERSKTLVAYTDRLGAFQVHSGGDLVSDILPRSASLKQNYPNPFNAGTTIAFTLDHHSLVRLEVFNILGQQVMTLLNEERALGANQVVWNGADRYGQPLASGIYYYRLRTESSVLTRKMVILK